MKVLLDTNVLLSAAWRDRLPEEVVHYVAMSDTCQWIATGEILSEYADVLRRPKFGLSETFVQQWSDLIQLRTIVVPSPGPITTLPRDPKDVKFLAAAISTNANFLITGDKDLLQLQTPITTRILTAAEFAAAFDIS